MLKYLFTLMPFRIPFLPFVHCDSCHLAVLIRPTSAPILAVLGPQLLRGKQTVTINCQLCSGYN